MFDHRPGDAETVIGAGASANLIQDDQAAIGGVVENVGSLVHFDHEGRVPAREFVTGSDPGKYAIYETKLATFGRSPAADLSH